MSTLNSLTLALLTDRIEDALLIARNQPHLLFQREPQLKMFPSEVARCNVSHSVADQLEEIARQFSTHNEARDLSRTVYIKSRPSVTLPKMTPSLRELYVFNYLPPSDYFDASVPIQHFLSHMPDFATSYIHSMNEALQKIPPISSKGRHHITVTGSETFKKTIQKTLSHVAKSTVGSYILSLAGRNITIEESSSSGVNSARQIIYLSLRACYEVAFDLDGRVKKARPFLDSVIVHEMVHIIQKLEGRSVTEGWHPLMKNTKEEEAIFFENLLRYAQEKEDFNLFHVGWNHYDSLVRENLPLMHISLESHGLDRTKVRHYKNKGHSIDALNCNGETLLSLIIQEPLSVESKRSDMLFLLEEGSDPFIPNHKGVSPFYLTLNDLELALTMLEDLIANRRFFEPNLVFSYQMDVNRNKAPYLQKLFARYGSLYAAATR